MTITKENNIDQITIIEDGTVYYREVTRFIENEQVISQTFHRGSVTPGEDISQLHEKVAAVCNTVWTEEVITAFQQKQTN